MFEDIIQIALQATRGLISYDSASMRIRQILDENKSSNNDTTVIPFSISLLQPRTIHAHKIPTGIIKLDNFLEGGLYTGELAYVSGFAKDGKTTMLITLGTAALNANNKVLHCTIEIAPELVAYRYAECFLAKSFSTLTQEEMLQLSPLSDKLFICDLVSSPKIASVEQATERIKPDLLIVDYGDLLHTDADNRFSEIGLVWEELRRIAKNYNCVVWTAGRLNRTGDEAESYLRAFTCDLHVILQVDSANATRGIAHIQIAEIRRKLGRWETIPIIYAPERAYIGGGIE